MDNWIFLYIFFEINLIKELGFDVNLKQHAKFIEKNKFFINIKLDNFKYEVPVFLIKESIPDEISENIFKKSLFFTRSLILNKFFLPNNLIFPKSRIIFENYFN